MSPSRTPKAAALYCRISRDSRGEGLGVTRQELECREWADAHGWQVAEVYIDNDISAYKGKRRPAYERMMQHINEGLRDGILAWHNDRLHRSPKELEAFIDAVEAARCPIQTVTGGSYDLTTSSGRMTARVVGNVARYESEHKSERIKAKHAEKIRNGEASGGTRPFGLTSKRDALVEEEAAYIRRAAADLLGGRSMMSIIREWNEAGVTTTMGNPWRPIVFRRLMTAEWTIGKRQGHKAKWPAILDENTHRRLVSRFNRQRTGTTYSKTLLAGIARCSLCKHTLVSQPRPGHVGSYRCPQSLPGACGHMRIKAADVEEDLLKRLWVAIDSGELRERAAQASAPDDDGVLAEIERLEAAAGEFAAMAGRGEISPQDYRSFRTANDAAIAELREQVVTAADERASREGLRDLQARWWTLDMEDKRMWLGRLCRTIEIRPAVRGRNFYTDDRLLVEFAV